VAEGADLGYPVQRPLFMHYENDSEAYDIQYQYLFGSDVLVAPVVEPGVVRKEVYLPEDEWVHLWTGKEYKGGRVTVDAPVGYPPVFYLKSSKFKSMFEKTGSLNKYE
jgi:alpha-glucosidase